MRKVNEIKMLVSRRICNVYCDRIQREGYTKVLDEVFKKYGLDKMPNDAEVSDKLFNKLKKDRLLSSLELNNDTSYFSNVLYKLYESGLYAHEAVVADEVNNRIEDFEKFAKNNYITSQQFNSICSYVRDWYFDTDDLMPYRIVDVMIQCLEQGDFTIDDIINYNDIVRRCVNEKL